MKKIIGALVCIVMASCNNNEVKTQATQHVDTTIESTGNMTLAASRQCFASYSNGDTIVMRLERNGTVAHGTLDYAIKEKDKNAGSFAGIMNGDTLSATYSFRSEGLASSREIRFLIQDDTAIEGYGEVEEKEGETIFKTGAKFEFGKGIILQAIKCSE